LCIDWLILPGKRCRNFARLAVKIRRRLSVYPHLVWSICWLKKKLILAKKIMMMKNMMIRFLLRSIAFLVQQAAKAFGGEGQYSYSIAEFVRAHAAKAGSLRVVAILIVPRGDDEQQCPLTEASASPEAFSKNWIEQTKWPFAASAVFVPNLRNFSPDDVLSALQTLPELVQWNPANEKL
jgi:hypothetical protein